METLTQGLLSLMLHCTGRLLADPHLQGGVMKWSMSTGVRSGGRPRAPTLCYPRSSSFHFLNVSKNARVVSIFSVPRKTLPSFSRSFTNLLRLEKRSSSFHFLCASKNVAVLFTFIHESFPKNRREKRWVPFSIACTKGFLFAIGVHDAVELTEQFRGPRFRVHSLGFWRLP